MSRRKGVTTFGHYPRIDGPMTPRPTSFDASAEQVIGHPVPLSVHEAANTPRLLPMSQTSLNDALSHWVVQRIQPGVTLSPGGWEEWIQLDLIGWLHDSFGASPTRIWDVQRNARIHLDPDRRVDLLFNPLTHDTVHPLLAVEILAQSPLVARPDLLNRMHFEAEQLRRQYLLPGYAVARRLILAVTLDVPSSAALHHHGFGTVAAAPSGFTAMWREILG